MAIRPVPGVGPSILPSPLWSTYCGVNEGVWLGSARACNPASGAAEGVGLDEEGGTVFTLARVVLQRRVADDASDCLVTCVEGVGMRLLGRVDTEAHGLGPGDTPRVLEQVAGAGRDADLDGAEGWEAHWHDSEDPGLFFFDGGSHSLGPSSLLGEPRSHCLAWGSDHRLRVSLLCETARDGRGRLDLAPLRLGVAAERWLGVPGVLVEGISPSTGEVEMLKVFEAVEQEVAAAPDSHRAGPHEGGVALLLAPALLVQLEASGEGGVMLRTLWRADEGVVVGMEREHDGRGELVRVLFTTAMAQPAGEGGV
ncbi:hypothetical protein F751_0454 [Auxenochlorella protothecoides]|uniref:Uncharacterized protein n=1 Tax=Auxenochlorella protothecoides TaxID=3075 RepID=A0A087SAA4_AUXPR|nr:hypothetical protein F751_0454 [Auxenochlorella protothecoides]KFM22658.1 hypothetical protein F751_0454 [Auxenochlorella protothecoides]